MVACRETKTCDAVLMYVSSDDDMVLTVWMNQRYDFREPQIRRFSFVPFTEGLATN